MTSEIKKPIFGRLLNRFGIAQGSSPALYMGDTVVPVTSADELTKKITGQRTSSSTTARTDTYTVPAGKRWLMLFASFERSNTGTGYVYLQVDNTGFDQMVNTWATATNAAFSFPAGVYLKQGDYVKIQCDSGTSGGINTNVIYMEEDY